jgi:hypothetical protein
MSRFGWFGASAAQHGPGRGSILAEVCCDDSGRARRPYFLLSASKRMAEEEYP